MGRAGKGGWRAVWACPRFGHDRRAAFGFAEGRAGGQSRRIFPISPLDKGWAEAYKYAQSDRVPRVVPGLQGGLNAH